MDLSGEIFGYVVDNGKLAKFQEQPSVQSGYDGALNPDSDYGVDGDGESSGVPLGYNTSSDLSMVLHDTCDALSQAIAKA